MPISTRINQRAQIIRYRDDWKDADLFLGATAVLLASSSSTGSINPNADAPEAEASNGERARTLTLDVEPAPLPYLRHSPTLPPPSEQEGQEVRALILLPEQENSEEEEEGKSSPRVSGSFERAKDIFGVRSSLLKPSSALAEVSDDDNHEVEPANELGIAKPTEQEEEVVEEVALVDEEEAE
ncbi:hypothetical protein BT96DRAFT_979807 [Gymnopus androsaceus JB14]|uniref:Uncharacterized protein n=1 Tax=Gymnopus androsaceus JB14 TaxID=1447944 RepID=A0A6A4H1M9_9AGAR|nr:hypothetical protein BT96DRAFT_979807 [Gymnopus androsaceus JB14]